MNASLSLAEATQRQVEILACADDPLYFVDHYCHIYDATLSEWIPFRLWTEQIEVLDALQQHRLNIILKARQLGMTWLCLSYALWLMIFKPAATILLFSKRANESVYLLGDERMRGMYARLPCWLRSPEMAPDSAMTWGLANGSIARAFPSTAGDSYTATWALVDEADLCPDLGKLMRSVKPTIDGGGQMVLLSRADKTKPLSEFKRIYRAAKLGQSSWHPIFLSWKARPDRDETWYAEQRADILHRTNSLDDLHEQYPATDTEALSARTLDKRISGPWLDRCFAERLPLATLPPDAPSLPGLEVYALPRPNARYVVCGDPAEGNPTSDDSALEVIDLLTGEEAAALCGKYQPSTFAAHLDAIGRWYNDAPLLVERNNHGHAVLLWLAEHSQLTRVVGLDNREGWLTTAKSKALMWSMTADAFRETAVMLYSFATRVQLGSIEGSSLRAPEDEQDDRAVAWGLCCVALMLARMPRGEEETWGEVYGV